MLLFFLLVLHVAFLSLKGCPVCEGRLQQKRLTEGGRKPCSKKSICSCLT